MLTGLAIALITVFALLASVHVYWAMGGRFALAGAVPEVSGKPSFRPAPALTFAVACALFACAALVAAVAGFLEVPGSPTIVRWSAFALAAGLLLRAVGDFRVVGFFKRVRGSRFAQLDSVVYSPLCLVLAIGVFTVAWHRGV